MNNQNIIKYIIGKKNIIGYVVEQIIQQQQDAEITRLYNKGYFNPYEYNDYMARTITYQEMMNREASRMNDMYYYVYVSDWYSEGYLDYEEYEEYEDVFEGFYYYGQYSYDFYIRVLEIVLQQINSNILRTKGAL